MDFSIIVAFYRGNKFINNLLRMASDNAGTLNRHYSDSRVELVIVNDSPDERVILNDVPSDILVKVINHDVNKGIHQARVSGIKDCIGDYILILDQDDEIDSSFLYRQYIKIGEADVCVCNAIIEEENLNSHLLYPNRRRFRQVLNLNAYIKSHNRIVSPGQCLIKKSSVPEEWTRDIVYKNGADDLFLWILMLSANRNFVLNEENLYTHKFTGCNLSEDVEKMICSTLEFVEKLENVSYVPQKDIRNLVRECEFKRKSLQPGLLKKLLLYIKYIDITIPCAIWKMPFFSYKYKLDK